MRKRIENVYRLGVKELISLRSDPVMVFLIAYSFTLAVYSVATGASTEVANATVAIADEDRSPLSRRIADALIEPYFQPPAIIDVDQIDAAMAAGRYTFVLDIPPDFQADLTAGRHPDLQLLIDATAMTQAGIGANYIHNIVSREILAFLQGRDDEPVFPVGLVIRAKFNPNLKSGWFLAVMQIINSITLLAIVLTGAALIREREHGTIEHLLVMPLRPVEIMLGKVWANGLVIVVAAALSLWLVVEKLLSVPIAGSIALFIMGTVIYLFSVTALGVLLATVARSMPQFGLLAIPVFIIMNLLSGGTTPLDSMPVPLQFIMQLSPSTHFVSFAQAILYRGAGLDIVWPQFLAVAGIGAFFFAIALLRFRRTLNLMQS